MFGISLSVAIMAHPRRLSAARALAQELEVYGAEIILDPAPDSKMESLRTAVAAWAAVPAGSTHHLVLQDDVALKMNFMGDVLSAIAAKPEKPLAFFAGWSSLDGAAVRLGALAGARWVESVSPWVPTLALVLPADIARGFSEFVRTAAYLPRADDYVMASYLQNRGVQTYISVPSLVEHLELPSLIGNDLQGVRRAACFDETGHVPGASWSTDPPPIRVVPRYIDGRSVCLLIEDDKRETVDTLSYLGLGTTDIASCLDWPRNPITSLMTEDQLAQLLITAFALGLFAAKAADMPSVFDKRLSMNALTRLAPGGLPHLARQALGADRLEYFGRLCFRAAAIGAENCNNGVIRVTQPF